MIRLIVAFDQKRGIGKDGSQPWDLPADAAYFSEKTKQFGGLILVGKTTFLTFHGPLPERINYIMSKTMEPVTGTEMVRNLDEFLYQLGRKDLWVVGGAQLYKEFFKRNLVDEVYVTEIEANFNCDAFFPIFEDTFKLVSKSPQQMQDDVYFRYLIYKQQ